MATISSSNGIPSLTYTSPSSAANGVASTPGATSQDAAIGSESTVVTIPSNNYGTINVYNAEGKLDGGLSLATLDWAQSPTDAVSSQMASDVLSDSVSGQFDNLGSALLDRFQTTGSNFAQSVSVSSTGATGAIGEGTQGPQGDIELTVETASGIVVEIHLNSGNGKLGVSVHSSGQLDDAERAAVAGLANGFQQALNGLTGNPPTLNLSGLMQYNPAMLSSVNMQFNVSGGLLGNVSGDFSVNSSGRSLSLTDSSGTINLSVNTSNSVLLGSDAQRDQAIASYLNQFDNANKEGHGNTAMMAMFKDAFTQLNSNEGPSSQQSAGTAETAALAQSEQSMLTGLDDFTASISDSGDSVSSPGTFSYQVSQTTSTEGDLQNGTTSQTQQSSLKASYQEDLAAPASYDDVQIADSASSTVKLATNKGILVQASLSQSSSQSTTDSDYVGNKLISVITTPKDTSTSKDLLALLKPFDVDGQTAQDSGLSPQALSTIHEMILLNANWDTNSQAN